ncbi:MAG: VWA domain-containing protein, partial [Planctomycetes bacterium]|nr:VWA domain-containing protein [Planctomycetota bacterium]
MIERRTICGFLVSAGFHAAAVGLLAWGTLGPPREEAPPMLVVSQWTSYEPVESIEFEVPLPPSLAHQFPVVAPPSAEPVAVALGSLTAPIHRDLSTSSDQPSWGFGLPSGTLTGSAGAAGGKGYAATFFGTTVLGNRFVYVVDASRSMAGSRFRKAKRELFRSISNLRPDQQYYVVFFGLDSYPMYFPEPQGDLVASEPKTWKRLHRWMGYVDPRTQPATNGKSAMLLALSLKPDAIYLLSDGVFTDDTVPALLAMHETTTPIHTIAFGTEAARADLQRIANQ